MRVLWVGDSPTVSTGFSRCTRAACDALAARGHDVHVLGFGYQGDPHDYPYKLYPSRNSFEGCADAFGCARTPVLVERLKPDVVVLLQDPWNVPGYFEAAKAKNVPMPPVVGWLAVDAENHPHSAELNKLAHLVTWTKFAEHQLRLGGYTGSSSIVPLGVNCDLFSPRDRAEARASCCPEGTENAFIVGVVGRNQPRKRIDLSLAYFAAWIHRHRIDDAYLYLHVAPTGERACDIRALASYYGLEGKVFVQALPTGVGINDSEMPLVYSAFDVMLTTTQGEGWGLTTHEAMACGVPCIVPDWSALGEWPRGAVVSVPCTGTALSAPLNDYPYTIGGVMNEGAAVAALHELYRSAPMREHYARVGRERATQFQWKDVGDEMARTVESVVAGTHIIEEGVAV